MLGSVSLNDRVFTLTLNIEGDLLRRQDLRILPMQPLLPSPSRMFGCISIWHPGIRPREMNNMDPECVWLCRIWVSWYIVDYESVNLGSRGI